MRRVIRWICWIVYGHVTDAIKSVDGGMASEVGYYDRRGRRIGYWAYGYWDPKMSWLARKACE